VTLPDWAFTVPLPRGGARLLLLVLLRNVRETREQAQQRGVVTCPLSLEDMAQQTGAAKKSLIAWLDQLESAGFLLKRRPARASRPRPGLTYRVSVRQRMRREGVWTLAYRPPQAPGEASARQGVCA
jgi:hypothetical protein